jgi:hypothetical protein
MSGNSWFFGGVWAGAILTGCIAIFALGGTPWRGVGLGGFAAFLIWFMYSSISAAIRSAKEDEKPNYRDEINRITRG